MKNLRLNNKGYLLVEIILASVLAIGMAYFMISLTIKVKDRNDDLLVKNLTSADQGIIYNFFMEKIYTNPPEAIDFNSISIDSTKKVLSYKNNVVVRLNKYATFGTLKNEPSNKRIIIPIVINNNQLNNENFDVIIYLDY